MIMDVTTPIVHVVDDDEGTRTAMARLLTAAGCVVRTHGSADDFLAAEDSNAAGCVVLDVRLPGLSGLDLQVALSQRQDPPSIIFLTGYGEIPDSVRAIRRGAVDFLTKPVEGKVLLDAVRRALAQDAADRAARAHRRMLRARYERLTGREREVLAHLIRGQLNKQVASDLSISERTIKLHRARILEKLEIDSMAGLTRFAIDLGIDSADRMDSP
jgi:FixJ family two-component response regulator